MLINGKAVFRKNPDVVCRDILDETILVPICGQLADMQSIYALDTVGAFIWSQLDGKTSVSTIHASIRKEYDVADEQALSDMTDFIDELVKAKLITLATE